MRIPFFSSKKNKEYYLGIFLKETQGIVMIFLKENDHLESKFRFIYFLIVRLEIAFQVQVNPFFAL